MNEPLAKFKSLVIHPRAGERLGPWNVPVFHAAIGAGHLAELLCNGYVAAQLGTAIHVFDPAALGTVPIEIAAHFGRSRPVPQDQALVPVGAGFGTDGTAPGPIRHRPERPGDLKGSKVVPIDYGHTLRAASRECR